MEITVHKFKENKLSGFTLSTEFFFCFFFDNASFSLSSYLSSWPKFPYAFIDLCDDPQQPKPM